MFRRFILPVLLLASGAACHKKQTPKSAALPPVFPGEKWRHAFPEKVGLDEEKLDELSDVTGGNGLVIRHGYVVFEWGRLTADHRVWSAAKPVFTSLLMLAVQDRLLPGVDTLVAEIDPRLRTINDGKDAAITWRHLASQTSGYGLVEKPGAAFAYNDFAIALYYDTLMQRVFHTNGTEVLKQRLAEPLGFEDAAIFEEDGDNLVLGRLRLSARDFARFGMLILRRGEWRGRQIIRRDLVDMMLHSPVPATVPLSSGKEAPMLPEQRSYGNLETRSDSPIGPGTYSFTWWLNEPDASGHRHLPDAPADSIMAIGLFGRTVLWIIPSLDIIVSWNQAVITDHRESIQNPDTVFNKAARVIRASVINPGL